jgi:hypothetical protein
MQGRERAREKESKKGYWERMRRNLQDSKRNKNREDKKKKREKRKQKKTRDIQ